LALDWREIADLDFQAPSVATGQNAERKKENAIAEYRKKFEEFVEDGEISFIESEILKDLQKKLKLTEQEVCAVPDKVLEPFGLYRENLEKYKQVFIKLVYKQGYPLLEKDLADLKKYQQYLELKDEDIALLEDFAKQQAINLHSDQGVGYTKLRDFLEAGQWFEADCETDSVMHQAVGRKEDDWIRDEELLNFPCMDLGIINRLWVKYSNGRFGFSVQKQIYLEVGGLPDGKYYPEVWEKFGDAIGWRVEKDWIFYAQASFDISAPVGHLPCVFLGRKGFGGGLGLLLAHHNL
jgi:hypothetical protein